jgi:hypothetical protein
MGKKFKPECDGIDHLNVYSQGKTALGRFLSNFSYSPIETVDGHFDSIEGYWYWLGSAVIPSREKLRTLAGHEAKEYGRFIQSSEFSDAVDFKDKILAAVAVKLESNPAMKESLRVLRIPLAHYYVYGTKVVPVPGTKWLLDYFESLKS